MKTVICCEPYDLRIVDREEPVVGAGDVLVRIRRVGLCGTDYHIYEGRHPYLTYPRVMGHELGGEVVQAPTGSPLRPGQIVSINPYLSCGLCIACRDGKPNACVEIAVLGVHADGGMCDLIAVPETAIVDATGLTLDQAAMVEFLAVGAHAVARASIDPGDRVLVVGAGPIGIATGLFAGLDGAETTLVDRRRTRLEYARTALGFARVATADDGLATALAEATAGEMFDVVFDATGALSAMAQSLAYVAHGGKLVYVGVAPGDLTMSDPEFHKRETTLLASRNALLTDFDRVVEAIRMKRIPIAALNTHSFPVDDTPVRLPELIEEADHVLKAIVHF